MAILNLDYYTKKDFYSDGDVEDEILDIVKNKVDIDELTDKKYPVLYHLSDVRANILNWYPFAEGSSALEVGAGCGAITGALCDKLEHVVSVDLSKRRSTINYTRNQSADNLEIYVGNFNDMNFGKKFDYAIINGVFEYAISFTKADNPYKAFLDQIKKHLTDDGKIIIAIENKYGLKYFAGAPEDHTNSYFLGLNGYEGNNTVRTFGKSELTNLLSDSGLPFSKYYYPYPDYKFPNEIFTDSTLKSCGYGRDYYNLNGDRYLLFNEARVARGLVNENVMDVFSNSFLVVASAKEITENENVIYAKINNDRAKPFRILTTISDTKTGRIVRKKPITQEAVPHIEEMIHNSHMKRVNQDDGQSAVVDSVPSITDRDVFEYKYIDNPTMDEIIRDSIQRRDVKDIISELKKLFSVAFTDIAKVEYHNEEFTQVFGNKIAEKIEDCVKDINIDLICDNIFKIDEKYVVIDCEWVFPFYIPVSFVKWRIINELYHKHNSLCDLLAKEEMFRLLGIPEEQENIYTAWNYHFSEIYVGANKLEEFGLPKDSVSLSSLLDHEPVGTKANSRLYIDLGDGFSEDKTLCSIVRVHDNKFDVKFEIPLDLRTKHVRWDPMENIFLKIKITDIESDAEVKVIGSNGFKDEAQFDNFLTLDPNYYIASEDKEISWIRLRGNLKYMTKVELACFYDRNFIRGRDINDLKLVGGELISEKKSRRRFRRLLRRVFNKLRGK